MTRTTWNFFSAGQLTFGPGAAEQLGERLRERSWRRALLVTDPHLLEAGVLEPVQRSLQAAGIEAVLSTEGEPEPSIRAARRAIEKARAEQPDCIVGIGGGSNMDLAKVTATVVTHGGDPNDYFGFDRVPGPVLPLVCLPTTAGTGSEVSHAAVLTDTDNQMKVSTLSNYLRPNLALVDPQLTHTCPPRVTADSGIDALTHAIEACTAVDFDRLPLAAEEKSAYDGRYWLGEALAEQAIHLIAHHLPAAVRNGQDTKARQQMALAATLAGLAFSNCGVALVHALEYPLGGALHCTHGAGNGLLLPYVMRFNLPGREATFAKIAEGMGQSVDGLSESEAAEKAIVAVETLRAEIGIPQRIRELGGQREQLGGFAEKSFAIERLRQVNPRSSTLEDFRQILESAW